MTNNFVLLAQKFCNDYFCDVSLNQNQFLDKVHELIKEVHSMDEKLLLLNEVIRISKLYCHEGFLNDSNNDLVRLALAN
jgi:hypothetical protein